MSSRARVWWGLSLAFWGLWGLAAAGPYVTMGATWSRAFALSFASSALWVPLTVWCLWSSERWPVERGRLGRGLAVMLGSAVAVCLLRAAVVVAANDWIG